MLKVICAIFIIAIKDLKLQSKNINLPVKKKAI